MHIRILTTLTLIVFLALPLKARSADHTDFDGFYIGGYAALGTTAHPWDPPFSPTSEGGSLIGAIIGYRHQYQVWVLGLEGDFGFGEVWSSDFRWCRHQTTGGCAQAGPRSEIDVAGRLRGTVGAVLADRYHIFVGGGLAIARTKAGSYGEARQGSGVKYVVGLDQDISIGWTLGIAGEVQVDDNLLIRAELMHDQFSKRDFSGSANISVPCCSAGAGNAGSYTPHMTTGRIAVIIKLN